MKKIALPVLLVLAVLVAYLPVLASAKREFVFDDIRFVPDNPAIHDLSEAPRYFHDLSTVGARGWGGIYRPLRTLDFAIDWAIASPLSTPGKVLWFHLRNVFYHAAAVLLAWVLFRRWGAGLIPATLGALVFALHPVQVESVAWITSRADVLFTVLFLWALVLHGRSRGMDLRFAGAAVLLLLALLAKESAVVFVGAAVLTDFFFRDGRRLRTTLARWPQYAVFGTLAIGYVLLWRGLHARVAEDWWHLPVRWGGSLWGSVLTMSRGFVYYLKLIFFPVDLAQDWYLLQVSRPDLLTVACLLFVAGLLAFAVVRAFRGGGLLSFAVLWFFIAIFPASNLYAPIGIPTAERFLYLPMVGVAFALGALLFRVWGTGRPARATVVALLVCFGAVTAERSLVWTTNKRLWMAAEGRFESPRSLDWKGKRDRIQGDIAEFRRQRLVDEDRLEEARAAGEKARRRFESSLVFYRRAIVVWKMIVPAARGPIAQTRSQIALCLSGLQRYEQALEEADASLRLLPEHYRGFMARALALYGLGEFREAAVAIEASLAEHDTEDNHENAAAIYEKLAMQYERDGNRAQSFLALKRAWEHLPDEKKNPEVYAAWRKGEAEYVALAAPLIKAVKQDPTDGESWLELATVYAGFGYYEPAGKIYHRLLSSSRPESGSPYLLFPYALYYWQSRDTEEGYREAARIYDIILRQEPENEMAHDQYEFCRQRLSRGR